MAEQEERILDSIFFHIFPPSPVAAIGPLTVGPSAEGGVGRALMEAALMEVRKQDYDQVRLVQSPSHLRSFALYSKCGFALREPLFLMHGSLSLRTMQKGMIYAHPNPETFLRVITCAYQFMDFQGKWNCATL